MQNDRFTISQKNLLHESLLDRVDDGFHVRLMILHPSIQDHALDEAEQVMRQGHGVFSGRNIAGFLGTTNGPFEDRF